MQVPDADETFGQNMPVLLEKMIGFLNGTIMFEINLKDNPEAQPA